MMTRGAHACLATVGDDAYLPGTVVLLSSFLRHNDWFDGDIVVIHGDGLTDAGRSRLVGFPNLRLHRVGGTLEARLASLAAEPRIGQKLTHLYSLEAFNLPDYDWILSLDSDIVCRGSVQDLIAIDAPLVCCPDQSFFWERRRNRRTYAPVRPGGAPDVIPAAFNVGVMRIAPARLRACVYDDLLGQLHPATWADVQTGHSDSVLLNQYFEHAWTQAPEIFNYLVSAGAARYTRPRAALEDAVLVHYLGRPKPWEPAAATEPMQPERRAAFSLWQAADAAARNDGWPA
jgi:lipopolysaccharide biosynthesis glycosyltransferase